MNRQKNVQRKEQSQVNELALRHARIWQKKKKTKQNRMNEFALSDRDAKAQYLVSQCITRYAQRRFLIQQQSTQKELNTYQDG